MTYSVRVVTRAADAPAALWEAGFAPPLEGRWWYETLEEGGLADQFTFLYAVVERDGRPVGLAPMFVADVPVELVVPDELMPVFRAIGSVASTVSSPVAKLAVPVAQTNPARLDAANR